MNLTTRERLFDAAARLFAESGYRGASVRDICNQARANPGAVSYHFGGKRHLYRAVLRRASTDLAGVGTESILAEESEAESIGAEETILRIFRRMQDDDTAIRLLLRDLADGGSVAVESLTPPLRSAFEQLATAIGDGDNPRASSEARLLFLDLAAPVFLLTAAWPVVARALGLEIGMREGLLAEMVERTLDAHGSEGQ